MASSFPNLPGYVPTQDLNRTNFKKISSSKLEQNLMEDTHDTPDYPLPPQYLQPEPLTTDPIKEQYLTTTGSTYRSFVKGKGNARFDPQYVKHDRHVLRFYGFFKESIPESNLETSRVRNLVIFLYLVDNTISMTEIKQMNSGIPQGGFLNRQNVPHPDEPHRFINAWDFVVRDYVNIFGKKIRIYNCDQYTRDFYQNVGKTQPEGEPYEIDNFESIVLPRFEPKVYSGLNSSVLNGRVPSQKQFLINDRKVLRYYVFSEIPYIMHYYLADDTMEVREIKHPNSGKGDFSLLLKRQKFPKKFILSQPGCNPENGDYIRDSDIKPQGVLSVFGRKFNIIGCDVFTQKHYKENYGITFPIGNGRGKEQMYNREFQIPPYNFFGNEEDSLGNCYRLVPKPPKKDYFKWVDNQIQLRFTAVMNTNKPEDVGRKFIITFYLNDDTLMVYEPQQRNSGIVSGKFLEKMKYKNLKNNSQFFTPLDFRDDKDVLVNSFSFKVVGCDERTRKWYNQNIGSFKEM